MAKQKTISQLKRLADKHFSLYVRHRDGFERNGEWIVPCITCSAIKPVPQMHAGHFQSRRYGNTRYNEMNVNGQCAGCNSFNGGEQYKYAKAIREKYGDEIPEQLEKEARQEGFKYTREMLYQVISDSKEYMKYYLG